MLSEREEKEYREIVRKRDEYKKKYKRDRIRDKLMIEKGRLKGISVSEKEIDEYIKVS